ncbi:hypothetical protein [Acinetobacter pollinis]|jgi:hypothetical protein|uniref:Uncharacterized protein n=1 Tax=Acinetobacter pollinis TaxID=2605270 RepID=A0ABU6DRL5_9GAMM|nr:hypothetical protein [Acinetobacter pollinis]MBF7690515.1 hypothetical protein [Acinetobacter pollinis]MBF7693402.1 hypothetical protein [Acinetobacter pollinis]MBF7697999.1 hypothetical protein [Acinetobacter pollinis]MBF7700914.1 hypothetical protein [Acinetobacter pollinis]MEB5476297.1 hypothetical protein [Acinetobacter pollinis]
MPNQQTYQLTITTLNHPYTITKSAEALKAFYVNGEQEIECIDKEYKILLKLKATRDGDIANWHKNCARIKKLLAKEHIPYIFDIQLVGGDNVMKYKKTTLNTQLSKQQCIETEYHFTQQDEDGFLQFYKTIA